MNCYNGEQFLRQAIDSVVAQSWKNWELIFWDNQSTDESAAIVKSYDDARIKYFRAINHTNLYEARNLAIEKATGELIAFLDVDDWWLTDKLELQVPLFSDPEIAIAYGNFFNTNKFGLNMRVAYSGSLPQGYILDALLEHYRVGLLTIMIRRSSFFLAGRFNPAYHMIGDFDLVLRMAENNKVACIQVPVAVYRKHDASQTKLLLSRNIEELETWSRCNTTGDSLLGKSKSFSFLLEKINYLKALFFLLQKNRKKAFFVAKKMRWGRLKIRIILLLFAPAKLLKILLY